MKTQQRGFVVEYKSARRRAPVSPSSIWGNTDIKSLVREAAAAHPFGQDVGTDALSDVDQKTAAASSQSAGTDNDAVSAVQAGVPSRNTDEDHSRQPDQRASVDGRPGSEKAGQKLGSMSAVRRRRETISDCPAENVIKMVGEPTVVAEAVGLIDELVLLDVENQRLRGLMVKHLKAQNSQLRTMLARFEID